MSSFDLRQFLQTVNADYKDSECPYAVMGLVLNGDLLAGEIQPSTPLGIFVHLGSFRTLKEAAQRQEEVSVRTGCQRVLLCESGVPIDYYLGGCRDKVSYTYPKGAAVEEIQQSLQRAKQRRKQVKQNLRQEVAERDDPNSLSYIIQQIYLHYSQTYQLEEVRRQAQEIEAVRSSTYQAMLEHFRNNPSHLEGWRAEARSRFKERHELPILESMQQHFDRLQTDSLSNDLYQHQFPSEASEDHFSLMDSDGAELVYATGSGETALVPTLQVRADTVSSSSTSAPTPTQSWRQVLLGQSTLEDFQKHNPGPPKMPWKLVDSKPSQAPDTWKLADSKSSRAPDTGKAQLKSRGFRGGRGGRGGRARR